MLNDCRRWKGYFIESVFKGGREYRGKFYGISVICKDREKLIEKSIFLENEVVIGIRVLKWK